MQYVFGWMSQVILALALPYFVITLVLGIRVARRNGGRLDSQETGLEPDEERASPYELYFLVPCLNEEVVIGQTVRRLLAEPNCTVILIDDGSSDETAARARAAAAACGLEAQLIVITRSGADSRCGKGAALNAAYPTVLADMAARGLDPNDVIVAVMDADGRLSTGAADAALAMFTADVRVGGVQLIVRIRDRRKLIAQFQDIEFWMISALSQFARSMSGTVSLGGNGQFTRLSALQQLTGETWSRSLTEDLDLGLRLVGAGWRVTTTTTGYVDQQAVDTFPRLLRQRTRWYQGHMDSIRLLPQLWRSNVNEVAILEVTSYLLVPWVIVLPWSILQQWIFFQIFAGSGQGIFASGLGGWSWQVTYAVLWYVLSFAPNLMIGYIYARRTHAVTLRRALVLGHLMIAWNYIGYVAAWRALYRMARRRNDWSKTTRSNESAEAASDHVDPDLRSLVTPAGGVVTQVAWPVVPVIAEPAEPGRHRDLSHR